FQVQGKLLGHDSLAIEAFGIGTPFEDASFMAIPQAGGIGDSRPYPKDAPLRWGIFPHIRRKLRPPTYEAQFSLKDVPELRELVQLPFSEERAERRYPRVAVGRNASAGSLGAIYHRLKFQNLKFVAIPAHTALPEEDRAR